MSTRMDKYREEEPKESRTKRNQEMYRDIDEESLENVNLSNNVSVLNANLEDMNIDELRDLLDKKYRSKESVVVDAEELSPEPEEPLEDTKEYDLGKVLKAAHDEKKTDYSMERYMKLRDTQYDILNSLNIDRKGEPEDEETMSVEDTRLMNLIKTVNDNELKNKIEMEEPGLLDDLKGSGNTEVLPPIDEGTLKKPTLAEELEKTKQLSRKDINDALEKEKEASIEDESKEEAEKLVNSFYTGKFKIEDSDMDDFKDIEKDMTKSSIVIKILVVVLVLIIIAIGIYVLNKHLNLGWF